MAIPYRETGYPGVVIIIETIPADQIPTDGRMADGAIILRLSFQLGWVYATVAKDGKVTRRRYRYGQPVKVQRWVPKDHVERGDYDHIR